MKKIILLAAAIPLAAYMASGQTSSFLPKHLAVLRAGNGEIKLHLKQSPVFIDEFASDTFNSAPLMTVAIPTNGPDSIFFNGHAATEGMLSRSADGRFLTFAGYGGNLLQESGTPSLLDIGRAFCAVDATGKTRTIIYEQYGGTEKMNPRGAVTDGSNHFWSCGNASGTAYYDAGGSSGPVTFAAVPDSRQVKIINGTLYTTLNGPDGVFLGVPSGVFSFVDGSGDPEPLPDSPKTKLSLVVQAEKDYSKIAGFDMNTEGTIAYTADAEKGIQKYVKTDGNWKFAYNFSIPQNIPAAANHEAGCFALTVDFTGSAPIVYATTTEGYNGCVNSNRVVRIVDTGAAVQVTTVAQAKSSEIAFRGIAFTPEAK
ncbi:MAG TPA: hypothetical protein VNV43_10140 [Candidatus Acidoferrales bacterium]|nr:hypothetical protein [Candidatus Acidoferrales bacterium]